MSESDLTADSEIFCDQDNFDWDDFTEDHDPAPSAAFHQPLNVPTNPFRKGHLLMAIDSNIPGCNVLAKIDKIYKCWVRVHFFELAVYTAQWKMCDSEELMPFDETTLHRHPDSSKAPTAFFSWIASTMDGQSENLAESTLFQPLSSRRRPRKNLFKVGSVLALFDEVDFDGRASPATVVGISGDNVRLRLADRMQSQLNEVVLPYYDRRLFPIEFMLRAAVSPNCHHQSLMSPSAPFAKKPRLSGGADASSLPIGRINYGESARRRLVHSGSRRSAESASDEEVSCSRSGVFESSSEAGNLEEDDEQEEEPRESTVTRLLPVEYSPFSQAIISDYQGFNWSSEEKERFVRGAAERLAAAAHSNGIARRLLNLHIPHSRADLHKEHLCTVQFECSEETGPFLDVSKVRQMPFYFVTKKHFQVQVQRVAQFLIYCGHSQTKVMEVIASVDGSPANGLEIYIRSEELQTLRIPKPRHFNMARYWVHAVLKALGASEKLIELVKADEQVTV